MPVVEERLSLLEVKMEEIGTTLVRIEGVLGSLFQMVQGIDRRFNELDQRVDRLDQRFNELDRRVDKLDLRFDRLDQRVDRLDERVVKLFLWVIGIQMTILIAFVAGLFGIVAKVM
jgi:chromosome segregation ATPase